MRRAVLAAFVGMSLAACGPHADKVDSDDVGAGPGYTLEVRADEGAQIFIVAYEDGRVAAARAKDGQSEMLDQRDARALLSQPGALSDPAPEQADVSFSVPGFSLSVSGDKDGDDDDGDEEKGHARVAIEVGGKSVHVDAQDEGEGDSGRAHVRITGATAQDAREFIAKADKLSPAVQAEMIDAMGL
jgi:hypothetical protein